MGVVIASNTSSYRCPGRQARRDMDVTVFSLLCIPHFCGQPFERHFSSNIGSTHCRFSRSCHCNLRTCSGWQLDGLNPRLDLRHGRSLVLNRAPSQRRVALDTAKADTILSELATSLPMAGTGFFVSWDMAFIRPFGWLPTRGASTSLLLLYSSLIILQDKTPCRAKDTHGGFLWTSAGYVRDGHSERDQIQRRGYVRVATRSRACRQL
jgi:hypothetical protein